MKCLYVLILRLLGSLFWKANDDADDDDDDGDDDKDDDDDDNDCNTDNV